MASPLLRPALQGSPAPRNSRGSRDRALELGGDKETEATESRIGSGIYFDWAIVSMWTLILSAFTVADTLTWSP
jgi:hypothetical protein